MHFGIPVNRSKLKRSWVRIWRYFELNHSVVLSLIVISFTGIQTYLLHQTRKDGIKDSEAHRDEIKKSLNISQQQATAAEKHADATLKLLNETKESRRSFLSIESMNFTQKSPGILPFIDTNGIMDIRFNLKNYGGTAVTKGLIHMGYSFGKVKKEIYNLDSQLLFPLPGQGVIELHTRNEKHKISEEEANSLKLGTSVLSIFLKIEYQDRFGTQPDLKMCLYWSPGAGAFNHCQ